MECMASKALKSSLSSEIPMKMNYSNGISDDFWCFSGAGNDDFSIDEFLDFTNEETNKNAAFLEKQEEEEGEENCSNSENPVDDDINSNSSHFSTELAIPDDDMQELELWSHLMDDSVPETMIPCPNTVNCVQLKKTRFNLENRFEPGLSRVPFIASAIPVKPRSKRPRMTGSRIWLTGSPKAESPSSSSSSSSPTSTLVLPSPVHDMSMLFNFGKPALKKPKKKPALVNRDATGSMVQRRCTHCQVTKTPQWRAGPNGPKTLCNACGVRFKSGRLFPEYRPACSPTFSSEVHSNSHRKVLEMRRKKEMADSMAGSASTISSN